MAITVKRVYVKNEQNKPDWYQNLPDYLRNEAQTRKQVDFSPAWVIPPKFLKANLAGAKFDRSHYFSLTEGKDMPSEFERVFMRNAWGALMGVGLCQRAFRKSKERQQPDKVDASSEREKRALDNFQQSMRAAFYMAALDHAPCQKTLPTSSTNQNPRSTILISASGSLTQTQIWIAHQIKTEPQWLEIVRVAMRFELVTSVSQLSGRQTRVFEKLLYHTIQV